MFDGVNDRVISSSINPYFFPTNDPELHDIIPPTPIPPSIARDAGRQSPMYVVFIPIGGVSPSSPAYGRLTRALCFDLVLKGWTSSISRSRSRPRTKLVP